MGLKELTALNGVSGNEGEVRNYIVEKLKDLGVSYETDTMGNIIARKGEKGPKVLVSAHMDEVGLMVVHIENNGFIKFVTIGVPPSVLTSKRVFIGKDRVPGVIGAKAIHLQQPAERGSITPAASLYIDIGATSQEAAQRKVKPGDYVVFDTEYEELTPDIVKAKALDGRLGCAILLDLLKESWDNIQLYGVFSVQKELGTRGARIAAYRVAPDLGIAVEGTDCNDTPPAEKHSYGTKLGSGVALSLMDRGSISDRAVIGEMVRLAEENDVPFQLRKSSAGTTDAGAIQQAREGCPVAGVFVPCRYIRGPFSLMSKKDFDAANKLLPLFLRSVEGGFRP